jgi:hypothetical protein
VLIFVLAGKRIRLALRGRGAPHLPELMGVIPCFPGLSLLHLGFAGLEPELFIKVT